MTHELEQAKASLGHYRGISAGAAFTEELSGTDLSVTVLMDGKDITDSCYANGKITIETVSGPLVITAKATFTLGDRLQQLPDDYHGINLWPILRHDREYYAVDGWTVHPSGTVYSVTVPVTEGERILASSFRAAPKNGGTLNGIRITFFSRDGLLRSVSAPEVYDEFSRYGSVRVPSGAVAVSIPMWTGSDNWELYILNTTDMTGNLNLDGKVDSDDLTLLARHVAGIETVSGKALLNADVNSDGSVNSDDLTLLARYVAGIITSWEQT